jgi:hypothetical protein
MRVFNFGTWLMSADIFDVIVLTCSSLQKRAAIETKMLRADYRPRAGAEKECQPYWGEITDISWTKN